MFYGIILFQDFTCPSQCICKGYAIYCHQTAVDLRDIHVNSTLLYLRSVLIDNYKKHRDTQTPDIYPNLSVLNITIGKIDLRSIHNFLLLVPNLRVLVMQNISLTDLSRNFFTNLQILNILELQGNHLYSLTSGCFLGCSSVFSLDLHDLFINTIQVKAFDRMSSLKQLNLSFNSLERLSRGILQSLSSLSIVDLRGNSFKDIQLLTFHGISVIVYTPSLQMCCFVPKSSTCSPSKLGYVYMYNIYLTITVFIYPQ